jgi:hypothetical protein
MAININNTVSEIKVVRNEDTFCKKFIHAGSEAMNVDGSETPVVFSVSDLDPGQRVVLQSISFALGAAATFDLEQFGNVAALANGIELTCGTNTRNIKDNADIFMFSSYYVLQSASPLLGDDYTAIMGRWDLTDTFGGNAPVIDNASDITITINDNLTSLPLFRMSCHGIKMEGE